ncbi:MAG: dihydrolipoamide dehydrogenase [Saprospiraceae bacterium]|jgi:dihydrolipoamide dehydrogenase
MSEAITVIVPELGDFDAVPVIEILVTVGDTVDIESPLVTLESDKATMDVPSSHAGVVTQVLIKVGDSIKEGDAILQIESSAAATTPVSKPTKSSDTAPTSTAQTSTEETKEAPVTELDVVVIGSGPGGYTAAFRAADLGLNTVLIERYPDLGGVCLNVGCIPSKALLHSAKVIDEAHDAEAFGISFGKPKVDIKALADWKSKVVTTLTDGLGKLAKQRKVKVIQGFAKFTSSHSLQIEHENEIQSLDFKHAVIATGSASVKIPNFPHDDPRLIDSTGALLLDDIPKKLLIVGGGIIGLEMATVYHSLGSEISIVEMMDGLISGADPDLVRPLQRRISKQYENIWLNTKVTSITAQKTGLKVSFEGKKAPETAVFDKVLVAVGRSPNGQTIDATKAGVNVTERGFIEVDDQQRTNQNHIFAIGDVVGQPMLAHKAVHEAKVAAEVIAGLPSGFDGRQIPSVAYTDPEVAWVGLTETEAKEKGYEVGIGKFPWAASGRSLSLNRNEGVTKILFDKQTDKIVGCGIVGPNAGDLIAEATLAIEMGADAQDLGLTIHPHPTLSETIGFSAEAFEGTITDLYMPKKKV